MARIVLTPGICGGKPRMEGHRVRVSDVAVWHEYQGRSADDIVSHIPSLTLANVHAALSYYYEHLHEMCEEIRADAEAGTEYREQNESILATKLAVPQGTPINVILQK